MFDLKNWAARVNDLVERNTVAEEAGSESAPADDAEGVRLALELVDELGSFELTYAAHNLVMSLLGQVIGYRWPQEATEATVEAHMRELGRASELERMIMGVDDDPVLLRARLQAKFTARLNEVNQLIDDALSEDEQG